MENLPSFASISPINRTRPTISIPNRSELSCFPLTSAPVTATVVKSPRSPCSTRLVKARQSLQAFKKPSSLNDSLKKPLKPIKSKKPAKFLSYTLEEIFEMYENSL